MMEKSFVRLSPSFVVVVVVVHTVVVVISYYWKREQRFKDPEELQSTRMVLF